MNSVNEKAPDIHGGSDCSSTCNITRNTDDDTSTTRLMLDCMEHICHEIIQHPETAHDKTQELVFYFKMIESIGNYGRLKCRLDMAACAYNLCSPTPDMGTDWEPSCWTAEDWEPIIDRFRKCYCRLVRMDAPLLVLPLLKESANNKNQRPPKNQERNAMFHTECCQKYHSLLSELKNYQNISYLKEFLLTYMDMERQNDSLDQSELQEYYRNVMIQNLHDDEDNPGCNFETHCLLLSIFEQDTLPKTLLTPTAGLKLKPVHTLRRIFVKYAKIFTKSKMNDFMHTYLRNEHSICEAKGWTYSPNDNESFLHVYVREVEHLPLCNHLERIILLSIFEEISSNINAVNFQLKLKPVNELHVILKQRAECSISFQELSENARRMLQKWSTMLPTPRLVRYHQSSPLLADHEGKESDVLREESYGEREECPCSNVENDLFDQIETEIKIDHRSIPPKEPILDASKMPIMSMSHILQEGTVNDLSERRQRLKAVTKDPLQDIVAKASTATKKTAYNQTMDEPTISEHLFRTIIYNCLEKIKGGDAFMSGYKLSEGCLNRILTDQETYSKFENVLSDGWYNIDNTTDAESDVDDILEKNLKDKYSLAVGEKSSCIRDIIEAYQNEQSQHRESNPSLLNRKILKKRIRDEGVEDNNSLPIPNMYKKQPSAKQLKFSFQESTQQIQPGSECEKIGEPCTPQMYKKAKSAQQLKFNSQSLDFDDSDEESANLKPNNPRRRKFSREEKEAIAQGVKTYGVGKWQLIQSKYYKTLKGRSSQNIKDCYRTMKKQGYDFD